MLIEILNKECKNLNHNCCHGCWESSDVEVWCNCACHLHYDKMFIENRGCENDTITELRLNKYQKNYSKPSTENGLVTQINENDLLTKSSEGSSQQIRSSVER